MHTFCPKFWGRNRMCFIHGYKGCIPWCNTPMCDAHRNVGVRCIRQSMVCGLGVTSWWCCYLMVQLSISKIFLLYLISLHYYISSWSLKIMFYLFLSYQKKKKESWGGRVEKGRKEGKKEREKLQKILECLLLEFYVPISFYHSQARARKQMTVFLLVCASYFKT